MFPLLPAPTIPAPTSSGPATKLFIKVHLYSTIEVRHTTTLNVAPTTPLAQIFDAVCRKRSVNPKDYLLKLPDMQTAITDLNQPFASLGHVTELFLMKKSIGTSAGDMFLRPPGEEAPDPKSALAVAHLLPGSDLAMVLTYKKFTVLRKMPMFMGRQERVLALDGEYLHILPAENRQFFDNHVKTSSYHMSSVIACKQNKKLPSQFRLELVRAAAGALPTATAPVSTAAGATANGAGAGSTSAGAPTATSLPGGETKVYEFEAADPATAAEICSQISLRVQLARPASTAGAAATAARGVGALVGATGVGVLGVAGMPTA
ncbi:hypothetical protein AMAG_14703 [Allomyces macrogynus ATCC 38327]|uniref:Uncharacterized protein n=1 Tax=Allomyces macrogynus (strain ATCC 38327) TaxID=578462 RepID=A0A0L0T701_ALLM3|nr:hypothetical protein AMAG_14703 [Allomyces macrogynus ATCC 38327]|eukprot:KNE70578.1 hypothetical protein AMAG_14703 [Allomyces macrogynus ATCC 38327]